MRPVWPRTWILYSHLNNCMWLTTITLDRVRIWSIRYTETLQSEIDPRGKSTSLLRRGSLEVSISWLVWTEQGAAREWCFYHLKAHSWLKLCTGMESQKGRWESQECQLCHLSQKAFCDGNYLLFFGYFYILLFPFLCGFAFTDSLPSPPPLPPPLFPRFPKDYSLFC